MWSLMLYRNLFGINIQVVSLVLLQNISRKILRTQDHHAHQRQRSIRFLHLIVGLQYVRPPI